MDRLRKHLIAGRHVVVFGGDHLGPFTEQDDAPFLVRVNCGRERGPLGPLGAARRLIAATLGEPAEPHEIAARDALAGLRTRLLGEPPKTDAVTALREACERLAQRVACAALVFDGCEALPDDAADALTRLLRTENGPPVSIVLVFHAPAEGRAERALIETVLDLDGVQLDLEPVPVAPAPAPLPVLDAATRRVLRAGALVGRTFEVELVGALLELAPEAVMEHVQVAADAGVELTDIGALRIELEPAVHASLTATLLPSLALLWHARLARLLGAEPQPDADDLDPVGTPVGELEPGIARPIGTDDSDPVSDLDPDPRASAPATHEDPSDAAPASDAVPAGPEADAEPPLSAAVSAADASTAAMGSVPREAPSPAPATPLHTGEDPVADRSAPEPGSDHAPSERGPRPSAPQGSTSRPRAPRHPEPRREPPRNEGKSRRARIIDHARAAQHALAARQPDAAARHFLAAAGEATDAGAYGDASELALRGLDVLRRLPQTPARRVLRVRLLCAVGRLQWVAAGGREFSLPAALVSLEEAESLLQPQDPPTLRGEVASLLAGVLYDMGDDESLSRALRELATATDGLMAAALPVDAARLLNDQAAVWVRLGDFPRANHLLAQAREVFEINAASNPEARRELAETHHLTARLTLAAPVRAGHEADAVTVGIRHAELAAEAYRELEAPREEARVHETLARLLHREGRPDDALDHLGGALEIQSAIGDGIGIARSAQTAAAILLELGRVPEALQALERSIRFNLQKGAAAGLEANAALLRALAGQGLPGALGQRVEGLAHLLRRAGVAG